MSILAGVAEVLIARERVAARVTQLSSELTPRLVGEHPPIFVAVLKGSTFFLADLIRRCSIDLSVDFMSLSAYEGSPGVVRIEKDLEHDVAGRNVVIVEDIVDTGFTLSYLRRVLLERNVASLSTVALLDKVARRIVPIEVDLVGFEIPDVFVIGYGLDFQGRYRNVPDIVAVTDLARLSNDPDMLVASFYSRRR